MDDSKDKEHRISNLKNMISNINENDGDNNDSFEEIEEDSELINYLNEDTTDYETLGIDDEYIYRPGEEDTYAVNLEENQINEDFIIKTPKTEDFDENNEIGDLEELNMDIGNEISDNFDNVINAKIGGRPILAIVSSILGVIFIIISIFIFNSRSERIIDNVVAGETNFMFVIFFIAGLFLLCYGIFKFFNLSSPFENITDGIDSIELNEKEEKHDEPEEQDKVLEKSKIPLDKESYKIGEFKINDLKATFKKPKKTEETIIENEEPSQNNDLIAKEIEEIEYEKAKLDGESIDEIFAEMKDIDESDK